MASTYIETGTEVRVYDSAVTAHDEMPAGTYRVCFSQLSGFSLQRIESLMVGNEKIYGRRGVKVDKVFRAFAKTERSLGVMLSGDKGQGKSLFLRMLAERAASENMPVVLVDTDYPELAGFVDSLGECLVVFDEFEKVFPSRGDNGNRQNQFLSLFDGLSSTRRIYCVTVNDLLSVSSYLVNRPGRFHYSLRFDYPGPDEVREYLRDQAPLANESAIEAAVMFSHRTKLNYDHLRAIAFELDGPDTVFADVIADLNIKMVETPCYTLTAYYTDGSTLVGSDEFDMFSKQGDVDSAYMSDGERRLHFSFRLSDVKLMPTGVLTLSSEAMRLRQPENGDAPFEAPERVEFVLDGQRSFAYEV